MNSTSASPAKILRDVFAAFSAGDRPALVALFAPDATVTVEGGPHVPFVGVHTGSSQIDVFFETLGRTATAELFEVPEIIESGDTAVAFGTFRFLVPSTGRRYAGDFALRIRVGDGLVRAYQIYENSYSVAAAFDPAA